MKAAGAPLPPTSRNQVSRAGWSDLRANPAPMASDLDFVRALDRAASELRWAAVASPGLLNASVSSSFCWYLGILGSRSEAASPFD